MSERTPSQHIPALDGVRGLAILLVIVLHLMLFGNSPADQLSAHVTAFGASGVDLFFVLSGFLITGILWDARSPGGLRRFWIRRVLRIWPLYLAVLAVLFVALPAVKGWQSYPMPELWAERWFYWLHATNLKAAIDDFRGVAHGAKDLPYNTGHLWSLAVEEQFYLLWPLVVLRIRTLDRLLRVSLGVVVGSWALRLAVGWQHPVAAYVLMPTRMDGLAMGAAVFALSAQGQLQRWRRAALVVAGVSLLAALGPSGDAGWEITSIHLACSVFHAALLTLVLTGSAALVDRAWLRFLGTYSYGIYVIHAPLLVALAPFTAWTRTIPTIRGWSLPGAVVHFLGVSALAIMGAVASYHLFERRFLRLKDRVAPALPRRDLRNELA